MMLRPLAVAHRRPHPRHPRVGASLAAWLMLGLFILLAAPGNLSAQQEEGVWRFIVRQSVTRGEAERTIQQLEGLPNLEMVALPQGAYAVYMGRFPTEDEAQRELERYLSQEGIRLGTVGFFPTASPTPVVPTPLPQSTPSPAATPQPTATQTPATTAGGFTAPPAAPASGGSELPWPLIIAIVAGIVVVGGGIYFFVLRKKEAPAPPPSAYSRAPITPIASRPKPVTPTPKASPAAASSATAKAESPKQATPEPSKAEAPAAKASAPIAFDDALRSHESPPPAAKASLAMPDEPQVDPAPSIVLNDIFADEPETPTVATPVADEGAKLDFLFDEEPKASAPVGNGSSGSSDEAPGIPLSFGDGRSSGSGSSTESAVQSVTPAQPAHAGKVIYEQNLSNAAAGQAPQGWTGSYDYAKLTVATEENGSGASHLRFEKETGIGSAYYSCQFPEAHGRLAFDFEIRCDDKNKYLLGFYIEKDQDFRQSVHALIHRTNAKASPVLRLQNESVPYEFGTWRKVRYEIDLVRHIIDGFVDGEPVIVGQRLTSCPESLNTLSIRDNLATTGVLLLRGIKITSMD